MAGVDLRIARTPRGRRLVVSRVVSASREAAWSLLTDTQRWPDWGPSVRAVDCDRRFVESGTSGRVQIPGGFWLPFEVTTCTDDYWGWRVARIPATGHRVTSEPGGCRVGFEMPLVALPYVPICALALARIATILKESRQ